MLLHDGCKGLATESIGAMATATEALLAQGQRGFLSLFPALPTGEGASFHGVRAIGGLVVSATKAASVGGTYAVSGVEIQNDARDKSASTVVRLESPFGAAFDVTDSSGKTIPTKAATSLGPGVFSFVLPTGAKAMITDAGLTEPLPARPV